MFLPLVESCRLFSWGLTGTTETLEVSGGLFTVRGLIEGLHEVWFWFIFCSAFATAVLVPNVGTPRLLIKLGICTAWQNDRFAKGNNFLIEVFDFNLN